MKRVTVAIVVAGILMALALGLRQGFDPTSVTILVLILVVGGISIAVADRSQRGAVGPAHCEACGGVLSPNAPFCKHCGTRRASPT